MTGVREMNNRIHLRGNWQAEGAGKQFALTVPGDVHSALLDAGHIEDPYWGTQRARFTVFTRGGLALYALRLCRCRFFTGPFCLPAL